MTVRTCCPSASDHVRLISTSWLTTASLMPLIAWRSTSCLVGPRNTVFDSAGSAITPPLSRSAVWDLDALGQVCAVRDHEHSEFTSMYEGPPECMKVVSDPPDPSTFAPTSGKPF